MKFADEVEATLTHRRAAEDDADNHLDNVADEHDYPDNS